MASPSDFMGIEKQPVRLGHPAVRELARSPSQDTSGCEVTRLIQSWGFGARSPGWPSEEAW